MCFWKQFIIYHHLLLKANHDLQALDTLGSKYKSRTLTAFALALCE